MLWEVFEHVVWHLAGQASPYWTNTADSHSCGASDLFRSFGAHVLQSFRLFGKHVPDTTQPQVTLVLRKRTKQRNVGRIVHNEKEVLQALQSIDRIRFRAVDMAEMSIAEQLGIVSTTDILIGVHGAGLTHIFFTPPEAILIEIHPRYRRGRHFRNAARLAGRTYMPMRSMEPVSCSGTSDEVPIDIQELLGVVDGAVRLARSFSHGMLECGSTCDEELVNGNLGSFPCGPGG